MQDIKLGERAVLMRFSAGLPGESRQDVKVSGEVKREKGLGSDAGKWEKNLYPKEALAPIKTFINEARMYHDSVTLPFDTGIGILPATLIQEYGDKMRVTREKLEALVEETFLANPQQWIDWAIKEHNGTFEPANYPGCTRDANGAVKFDASAFQEKMRKKFYLRTEPLPVPNAEHFQDTLCSLLGADAESVNIRVRDAAIEAQQELMRRIMEPVAHMANTLAKDNPRIFATLTGNIDAICKLAPKLNLAGDAALDSLVKEVEALTRYSTETLRDSEATRDEARKAAEAMLSKLSAYRI